MRLKQAWERPNLIIRKEKKMQLFFEKAGLPVHNLRKVMNKKGRKSWNKNDPYLVRSC